MCFAPQRRVIFGHLNFKKWAAAEVFCTVWLEMCIAPQRRAIFRHQNFKKRSAPEAFCTFWLGNVLRATAACNSSTSELPKVVWSWCVLYTLTWKRASRYSGVQFFISPLNSYLRTRRFSEPTFGPSRPTNHWKNTAFRDFPNVSRLLIFFLLTFAQFYLLSSDSTSLLCFFIFWLCYSALLFQLSILSEVRLLNFLWLLNYWNDVIWKSAPVILQWPFANIAKDQKKI